MNRLYLHIAFMMLGLTNSVFSQQIIPFEDWEFEYNLGFYPAKVPGVIHTDLFNNQLIEHPYRNNNELNLKWIEERNWEYHTTFELTQEFINANAVIELVMEGLDTYATITINNTKVFETDNMFRGYELDIKPYIQSGTNTLHILFESPLNRHQEAIANQSYELPAANETVDFKVSPYTRKAAYQFGWDWGPRFVTAGIWRPIYLRAFNEARITGVYYETTPIINKQGNVILTVDIQAESMDSITAYQLKVFDEVFELQPLKKGLNRIQRIIKLTDVETWNPIGHGEPIQYESVVKLKRDSSLIAQKPLKIAFRQVELINESDSIGTSFFFKINDKAIFVKGANYIPQDLFLPNVDSTRYEKLIQQVVDANINMLRVWGGGIYEDDYFYDLCDANGIMVWQDFMFANSMYPSDSSFLSNIKAEVIYNVKRLQNHPSIMTWCGNNEIQVAWENWGWQQQFNYSPKDSAEIYQNYLTIFDDIIPSTLKKLTPNAIYVPTTPLSNWGKPSNFNHATMHYWGVWHGKEPIENYRSNIPRFMTEYGYQSYPSYSTLTAVIDKNELYLNSEVIQNRQKSYIGNGIIEENILKYLYEEKDFENWIELSQLVQAYAMDVAIKAHRTGAPHCMGTMFWQLNDCWPGPSWSVIDYFGNPKKAYSSVQKYYQRIVANCEIKQNSVSLKVVSDKSTNLDSLQVVLTLMNGKQKEKGVIHENISLQPNKSICLNGLISIKDAKAVRKKKSNHYFKLEIVNEKGELLFFDLYNFNKNKDLVTIGEIP